MMAPPESPLPRVTIPKLDLPDIAVTWSNIDISVRQLALLIGGSVVGLNVWFALDWLGQRSLFLLGIRGLLAALPFLLALAFGWIRIQGRTLEYRLFAVWRYRNQPRIYVRRSLTQVTSLEIRQKDG